MARLLRTSLAVLLAAGQFGCASVKTAKTGAALVEVYQIGPGDVISITVLPAKEYSHEVTVQPDGKIEMPLIGSIKVTGLTTDELQKFLRDKLSRYVANPEVTINVRRFSGRRVAILGEVRTPGYFEYRDRMRLLELVSMAGGLTDNAKATDVRVLRPSLSGKDSFTMDFKSVLNGDLNHDVVLAAGDTVYVPKQRFVTASTWVNTNILPWAVVMSIITSAVLISR